MSKPLDPEPWTNYSGSSRYRDNPERDPFVFFEPRGGYSVVFEEYPITATWYRTE